MVELIIAEYVERKKNPGISRSGSLRSQMIFVLPNLRNLEVVS